MHVLMPCPEMDWLVSRFVQSVIDSRKRRYEAKQQADGERALDAWADDGGAVPSSEFKGE